jgi:hypothetical protein
MKKTDLIEVRHPDVEKSARVPRSALRHMEGWTPANDDAADAEETDTDSGDDEVLKGKALDAALTDAGLPTTGTADEKRARLADHPDDNTHQES